MLTSSEVVSCCLLMRKMGQWRDILLIVPSLRRVQGTMAEHYNPRIPVDAFERRNAGDAVDEIRRKYYTLEEIPLNAEISGPSETDK